MMRRFLKEYFDEISNVHVFPLTQDVLDEPRYAWSPNLASLL